MKSALRVGKRVQAAGRFLILLLSIILSLMADYGLNAIGKWLRGIF